MSKPDESGRIRVLYVGKSPSYQAFMRHLSEGNPDIDLTTTNQPEEILNILRNGFDCLILDEKKPYIDGAKITKTIRDRGFPYLPIIIHKKDQKTPTSYERVEVYIFFDKQRDFESAQRLAEVIKNTRKNGSRMSEKRSGFSAPIGD